MRCTLCLAALLSLGLYALVRADAPTDKLATDPNVNQFIEQLADRDYRKRDLAVKALEAFGPKVLPDLRKAKSHADPEVRRRLDDLIPSLEMAAMLTPKRVTAKFNKKPIKEILDEITKQTGYKMESWAGGNEQRVYSFEFKDVSFWEALDKITEESGLVLQQGYGDDRLRFNFQDCTIPHTYREGPFRIVANSFNYSRNVDFSTKPKTPAATHRNEYLQFSFTIYVEPKLPILQLGQVKLSDAYDEAKVSMIPTGGNGGYDEFGMRRYYRYGNGYRCYSQQASVNLMPTSEKSRSVRFLRGTVPVTLLAEQKPEVVSDKILTAKGKKAKCGNTQIHIEDVTETPGKQYQIKMSISEDGRDNDWTWTNSLYQRIELHDEKGNRYQSYGTSFSSMGAGNVQVTFTYGQQGGMKMGVPHKLIFHTWNTIQHQVAFEFHDLPLP